MFKLLSFIGAIALSVSSAGQASAASVLEDISVLYTSNVSFNISGIQLVDSNAPLINLIQAPNLSFSGLSAGNSKSLFSQQVTLTTGDIYTFSFGGTFHGSVDFTATGVNNSFLVGSDALQVNGSVSPVPLPASLPLFALALIGLVGFAYQARRKRDESVAAVESSVSATALC